MGISQIVATHLGSLLLVVVASGLLVRRRVAVCWSFFAYVLATLGANLLITSWPDRFYEITFFAAKEAALVVLKIGVAFEIGQRTFSAFPRARLRVGIVLVAALLATAAAAQSIPNDRSAYAALVGALAPRQQAGTLWLFAIVGGAAAWYRVPLHPLHRIILVGFGGYLIVWTFCLALMGSTNAADWASRLVLALDSAAYCSAALLWSWAAWRPLQAPSPILARLQPWARSW